MKQNIFILFFFIFSLFCSYALATPALVVGDIESLPLLTYTSYLEGHPVLFFTQQLSAEHIAHLLKKNKNIVFFESNFMDLVLSTVESSYRHKIPDKGQSLSFRVKNEDTYEVWGMRKGTIKKVILDGKGVKEEIKDEGIIWKRLIREKLKKGEHTLSMETQDEPTKEVIIIPSRKIEEYVKKTKNLVSNFKIDLAYIVSEETSKGLMKRPLSLYKDSDYNLKVKVSENFAKIKNSGLYLKMGEPSEKKKWFFNSLNTDYSFFPSEDLLLFTYFNGDSEEDEFVEIKREKIRVDLERYPYIKLVYGVEDPNTQTIDIIAGIDFTGNGKVDKDVSLREEIILKNWKKTTPENKTMDFFETTLPSEWPREYTTKFPSRERFIVYKDKVLLETTWGKWSDYQELVEIGVKAFNRLIIAIPKGESPEDSVYRVSCLPGIRESNEFKGFNQLETDLRGIINKKFPYKDRYFLVNLKLRLRKVPRLDCSEREEKYKYYLKNIQLYSNLAVIIPVWKSNLEEKRVGYESKNVVDYNHLVSTKGEALINCYFDGKAEEEEYVKLDIPVAGYNVDKYPFLDIVYKWDDALVQAFDGKIGVDFTEDGVVDKEISLTSRKKVVLGKWEKSVPGNETMDFYETRLPLEWPKDYTTQYPSLGKFTVYKNGIPMRTAWRRWDDYKEFVEIGFGEYNRLVIAVPRGASPEENVYTVSYLSLAGEVKSYAGFNELRVNLKERLREIIPEKESIKIMDISLYLRKGEGVDCSGDKRGIYTFNIKEIKAYKISNLFIKEMLKEDEETLKDIPLFKVGDKVYSLKDMDKVEIESESLLGEVEDLHLSRGDYEFFSIENETFKLNWFIMEPSGLLSEGSGAKIEFRKINPTRYTVYAETEKSFWLVFSESFHKGWKAYIRKIEIEDDKDRSLAKKQRFEWSALITLLRDLGKREELREHYLVNGYANGWWVPVEADSEIKRFEVILEFTPQRLFEIGIVISGVTFIFCVTYLVRSHFKKRRRRRV